jgi:DNA-binding transcriptional ArsR family regulator
MARAILLASAPSGLHLRVEASPVYDFLAALFVVHRYGPALPFDVPRGWVTSARRALGPAMRRLLAQLVGPCAFVLSLVSLLDRRPQETAIPAFIQEVGRLPADELVLLLLTSARGARRARQALREILTARGGDREVALRRFAEAFPEELGRPQALALARLEPTELKAQLVRLLRRFYEAAYAPEEERVRPILLEDAERKRQRALKIPPEAFVEEVTGGLALDPTMVAEVVIAPSYFVRPYNLIADHGDVRTYITPTGGDVAAVDPEEVVLRAAKALADATRLRILRLVSEREMYVQQIAEVLGASHVTVLHHLAALRAARLVRAVERRNLKYYVFRPEGLAELEAALARLLPVDRRPER